jgi:hypothetical protein
MKPYILLIVTSLLLSSCAEEARPKLPPGQYQITVNAEGVLNGIRAYIKGVDQRNRQVNVDTAMVVSGSFTFYGKVTSPAIRIITVDGIKNNLPFVLEEGVTYINLDKENIVNSVIDGPENNQGYQKFNSEFKRLSDEITSIRSQINQARQDGNNELTNELLQKNSELTQTIRAYPHDFIDENPNLNFSLLLLESQMAGQDQNLERFKSNFQTLSNIVSSSPQNQQIGQRINTFIALKEAQAKTDIGKVAPNFTSTTPDGETLSLNDIKGKVTIIDFWASWCKPCRVENPNVVRVYEKSKCIMYLPSQLHLFWMKMV